MRTSWGGAMPMERVRLDRLIVMVVADDRHTLNLMSDVLRTLGIRNVFTVSDAAWAFREMRINPIDIVFVDRDMLPLDGPEFVRMLRTARDIPKMFAPVVMLTAETEIANVTEARAAGVHDILAKPVSTTSVHRIIRSLIDNPQPFIRAKTYSGPDRRRRRTLYKGPEKRKVQRRILGSPP